MLDALAAGIDDAAIRSFERRLTGGLPDRIDLLSRSLDAEEVTIESFPPRLHEQWIAGDGRYRLEIHPSENLDCVPPSFDSSTTCKASLPRRPERRWCS